MSQIEMLYSGQTHNADCFTVAPNVQHNLALSSDEKVPYYKSQQKRSDFAMTGFVKGQMYVCDVNLWKGTQYVINNVYPTRYNTSHAHDDTAWDIMEFDPEQSILTILHSGKKRYVKVNTDKEYLREKCRALVAGVKGRLSVKRKTKAMGYHLIIDNPLIEVVAKVSTKQADQSGIMFLFTPPNPQSKTHQAQVFVTYKRLFTNNIAYMASGLECKLSLKFDVEQGQYCVKHIHLQELFTHLVDSPESTYMILNEFVHDTAHSAKYITETVMLAGKITMRASLPRFQCITLPMKAHDSLFVCHMMHASIFSLLIFPSERDAFVPRNIRRALPITIKAWTQV